LIPLRQQRLAAERSVRVSTVHRHSQGWLDRRRRHGACPPPGTHNCAHAAHCLCPSPLLSTAPCPSLEYFRAGWSVGLFVARSFPLSTPHPTLSLLPAPCSASPSPSAAGGRDSSSRDRRSTVPRSQYLCVTTGGTGVVGPEEKNRIGIDAGVEGGRIHQELERGGNKMSAERGGHKMSAGERGQQNERGREGATK